MHLAAQKTTAATLRGDSDFKLKYRVAEWPSGQSAAAGRIENEQLATNDAIDDRGAARTSSAQWRRAWA